MNALKLIYILVPFCVLSLTARAQNYRAQEIVQSNEQTTVLSGRVLDTNGAVIVGARVKFISTEDNKREAITNNVGEYELELSKGIYKVEVKAIDFLTFRLRRYLVPSEGKINLDVSLIAAPYPICILKVSIPKKQRVKALRHKQKS